MRAGGMRALAALGLAALAFVAAATPEALRAHLKHEIETLNPMLIKAGVKAN